MSVRTSERFKQLDQKTQTILDALLANMKQPACPEIEAQDQTRASSQLLSRVDAIVTDQQRLLVEIEHIRSSIEELKVKNGLDKDQTPEEMAKLVQRLQLKVGLNGAVWDEERAIREAVENNTLESLRFLQWVTVKKQ